MIRVKKLAELTGHKGAVYALAQSENLPCFYTGSSDKIIAKWNMNLLNAEKFAAQMPAFVYSLCYMAEKNTLLAGTSEGKIHVLDLNAKKEIKILQNHILPVFDLKTLPSGKESGEGLILSAGGDGVVSILSADDFSALKLLKLCNDKLRAITIVKNNAAIASGDGMIRIIDLKELKVKHEFAAHTGSVYSVTYSPEGTYLLSGGKDAHLNRWRMENAIPTDPMKLEMSIPAHNYAIYSIVFSPDGKYLATASRDKTIKIWDTNTWEVLTRIDKKKYDGHTHSVNKLLWSKYNNYLISTGDDRKVMVWEIKSDS